MKEQNLYEEQTGEIQEMEGAFAEHLWFHFPASGLYQCRWMSTSEELRLDVDKRYPQMVASGTIHGSISSHIHWIANLTASGPNSWTGTIWYKDGNVASFPYTNVEIKVIRCWFPSLRCATVTFSGGGGSTRIRAFKLK